MSANAEKHPQSSEAAGAVRTGPLGRSEASRDVLSPACTWPAPAGLGSPPRVWMNSVFHEGCLSSYIGCTGYGGDYTSQPRPLENTSDDLARRGLGTPGTETDLARLCSRGGAAFISAAGSSKLQHRDRWRPHNQL